MYRILVIGAVKTTQHTIDQLFKHGFDIVGILGHEPVKKELVSGWVNLKEIACNYDLAYKGFKKINDEANINWARNKNPDIIFAVGFSQLMSNEWLEMPKLGCIGFHPTLLPKGRGRAPIAWIILEQSYGSATFFLMGEGADDGPVFSQKTFKVEEIDDAESIEKKIEVSIKQALDSWLPKLKNGIWNPIPQDEKFASWNGKRSLEDGLINWGNSSYDIDRLIKASSVPHPGAYTYFKDHKLIIWKSQIENEIPIKGVIGRVLLIDDIKGYLIQCGEGLLWLKTISIESNVQINIGNKLGYNIEDEIFNLKKIISNIARNE